jgi:hypothetical protein
MSRSFLFVLLLFGTLCLAMTLTGSTARAGGVEYTWTLAALGQGGWIGGPLFEDGTAGGGGAFSAGNGSVVAKFIPTTWTENASGQITVCFDVVVHKGSFPPSLCIGPADVTGTPIKLQLFGSEHIFRITELH